MTPEEHRKKLQEDVYENPDTKKLEKKDTSASIATKISDALKDNVEADLEGYTTDDALKTITGTSTLTYTEPAKPGVTDNNKKKQINTDAVEDKNNPIMEFTKLVVGTKFQADLKSLLDKPGFSSLSDIVSSFLKKFYYNIYTVPNLPNGNCILVKPETLFVKIPKCNVILPCMKSQLNFSRSPKMEPTRILSVTDPLELIGANSTKLAVLSAIEFGDETRYKAGNIVNLANNGTAVDPKDPKTFPPYKLTNYEKRLGPRIFQNAGGGDLLAFVLAGSSNDNKQIIKDEAANILKKLSFYKLLHARYMSRMGSISMYFNPYITPGFPMASLEEQTGNDVQFNVYGYVTNVIHNITDNSWSTTVSFSSAYTDGEVRPDNFPIAEEDYKPNNIGNAYAKVFGSSECYPVSDVGNSFADLVKDGTTVTDAYNAVKRPATTLKELFSVTNKDLEVTEQNNIMVLKSSYFNAGIQKALIEYSTNILSTDKHYALHTKDVR